MDSSVHILLLILSISFQVESQSNSDIWGRVTDESTGEPIEAASVFLKYTMLGSATNEQGFYAIENVEAGTYELVVSRIGYASQSQAITLDGSASRIEINHELQPEIYELGSIAVNAERPRAWKRQYEEFRQVFLGTMPFEEEAEILNPYGLDFRKRGSELRAWGEEILVIENRALDYRIHFQLMGFVWNGRILEFSGAGYYEEMDQNHERAHTNRSRMYSWLARSNPSLEGEWKARVIKSRCKCDLGLFGVPDLGSCQCAYEGLTSPSFQGKYNTGSEN